MTHRAARWLPAALLAFSAGLAFAQIAPLPKSEEQPHGIDLTDTPPLGGAIAIPLPEARRKKLQKYEIPELAGAHQALGPQRINGNLRRPLLDYSVRSGAVMQRVSFFEGGLACVHLMGAGGVIQKKLLIPDDAVKVYLAHLSPASLSEIPADALRSGSLDKRKGTLRIYSGDRFVERSFDPSAVLPRALSDQIMPLEDLLRAISEDRQVSNSITGYQPRVGDHLVGDDRKTYEVIRIFGADPVVELRCDNQPTTIYVAKKDLYNYFIGSRKAPSR